MSVCVEARMLAAKTRRVEMATSVLLKGVVFIILRFTRNTNELAEDAGERALSSRKLRLFEAATGGGLRASRGAQCRPGPEATIFRAPSFAQRANETTPSRYRDSTFPGIPRYRS